MHRRLLHINPRPEVSDTHRWRLETLWVETMLKDPRQDYFTLSGEALCQYILRRTPHALIIARGPLVYLSGNKATIGYISPLTGLPHYSFVGGRIAAQLHYLGLDAIVLFNDVEPEINSQCGEKTNQAAGDNPSEPQVMHAYVVITGRTPELSVEFKSASDLPAGQRSAYYWLLQRELGGLKHAGSILTLGHGARHAYRTANLAAEGIYHAGRGGAGDVFARYASALVLQGQILEATDFFPQDSPLVTNPDAMILPLLEKHTYRLSCDTGGTIPKLAATGAQTDGLYPPDGRPSHATKLTVSPTLPAWNAQRLGYPLADIGDQRILRATRHGQTGCHWCQVDCRHWHWVPADYAPGRKDIFLDDFEPTYAIFAMLGLLPKQDTFQGRLDLLAEVDQRVMLPLEEMGCDVMDIGIGLAAFLEGIARGLIPSNQLPVFLKKGIKAAGATTGAGFTSSALPIEQVSQSQPDLVRAARSEFVELVSSVDGLAQLVQMLVEGKTTAYPALRAIGDGPQALVKLYPHLRDFVFTCGEGTLGNAGHCNNLWTFLMPFSRFFGHYVGQYYKVEATLPPPGSTLQAYQACFEQVVHRLLQREFFWGLCNALSMCAFTFVIFSQDAKGEHLSNDDFLVRLLGQYGIQTTRVDLEWFAQAFWAQSIDLKRHYGWKPMQASDFPKRIYQALALALDHSPEELETLMDLLISEWKRQAGEYLLRFGYQGFD